MPKVKVHRHARIRRAIIDREVVVPRGAVIGYDLEEDRRRHTVTEKGVGVVTVNDDIRVLEPSDVGGYVVTSPLDPELITEAETLEEAFANARDAASNRIWAVTTSYSIS